MKKYTILIFILVVSLALKAQYQVTISGQIHDDGSTQPAAFHPLIIAATTNNSQVYFNNLVTDAYGFYADSFQVPSGVCGTAFVVTPDCQSFIHDTIVSFSGTNNQFSCNFNICVNPPGGCQADFTMIPDTIEKQLVHFTNTSTGNYTELEWNFGDGNYSSDPNPDHFFAPGTYDVCLTVSEPGATCVDSVCRQVVIVGNYDCQSYFTHSANEYTVAFQAYTNSPYATEYSWDYGDGNSGSGDQAEHIYAGPGTYYVTLESMDNNGCEWLSAQYITVEEVVNCNAEFKYMVDPEDYMKMHFVSESSANITNCLWDFGDGQTSTEMNPAHVFQQSMIYNVCLNVYVGNVCTSSKCYDIQVGANQYFTLAGQIFAGILPVDTLDVHLFRSEEGVVTLMDSATMGAYGVYYFYGLPAGSYFVRAALHPSSQYYGKFLPTYSGNTNQWNAAELIMLDHNYYNANIQLLDNPLMNTGLAEVSGSIYYDFFHDMPFPVPASNVAIYLNSFENNVVHCAFSDENGYFAFSDVPFGNYSVIPEITGKYAIPLAIELNQNNDSVVNINFTIKEMTVTYSIQELQSAFVSTVSDVYPNPATNRITLSVEGAKSSELKIELRDVASRILFEKKYPINFGHNTLSLDIQDYPEGIYLLTISTLDQITLTRKIVKK